MSIYPTLTVFCILLLSLYYHRSIFHPVCIQSALWFCQLGGLWLLQDQFDHVSTRTLWLIVSGVIGFGLGGTVASAFLKNSFNKSKYDKKIAANDFTVLIILILPILLYVINTTVPFTPSILYISMLNESLTDTSLINFGYI